MSIEPKFKYARLLNALSDMQHTMYYATRKGEIREAELAIVALETELAAALETNAELEQRIKESREQEPFCYKYRHHSMWGGTVLLDMSRCDGQDALETIPLYTAPVISENKEET